MNRILKGFFQALIVKVSFGFMDSLSIKGLEYNSKIALLIGFELEFGLDFLDLAMNL